MEATIRDGGYVLAHDYLPTDVAAITAALDAAGFSFIEVGHGSGVGCHLFKEASVRQRVARVDDRSHLALARQVARRAKIGVLLTAGARFCPLSYVDEVAAMGADFIRFGAFAGDMAEVLPYVERAKHHGLLCSLNLMQTYASPTAEIAAIARDLQRAGCDWFYVVDSAGGMAPEAVGEYVRAARSASDLAVGFHAHDNSGLALAGCIAAIEAGATLLDGTLGGMGRSAGNPGTERLVTMLQARGHEPEVDLTRLFNLTRATRSLLGEAGVEPLDVVSGVAQIHSRNMPKVLAEAEQRGLEPASFTLELGRVASERGALAALRYGPELFDAAASTARPRQPDELPAELVAVATGELRRRQDGVLSELCADLRARKHRHHKRSALHLAPRSALPADAPLWWESKEVVGLSLGVEAVDELGDLAPDFVLLDPALGQQRPGRAACWHIDTSRLWQRAQALVAAVVSAQVGPTWSGGGEPSPALAAALAQLGLACARQRPDGAAVALVPDLAAAAALDLRAGDAVVVARAESTHAVSELSHGGVRVYRPDLGRALAAEIDALLALERDLAGAAAAGELVPPLVAPGDGQQAWVPELGEPVGRVDEAGAARVATAHLRKLWSGHGRF